MKTRHFFMLLAMLSMVAFQSCKDDEPDRDKFIGTFATVEDCGGSNDNYDITISNGTDDDEILINNFYNVGDVVTAQVNGDNISYNETVTDGGTTVVYSGTGEIDGDMLSLTWTIVSGGYNVSCTSESTRK